MPPEKRAGQGQQRVEAEQDEVSLRALLDDLQQHETAISERRRAVQDVFDAASAEITSRYRSGRADVSELLRNEGA